MRDFVTSRIKKCSQGSSKVDKFRSTTTSLETEALSAFSSVRLLGQTPPCRLCCAGYPFLTLQGLARGRDRSLSSLYRCVRTKKL